MHNSGLTSLGSSKNGDAHDEGADIAVAWLRNRDRIDHVNLHVNSIHDLSAYASVTSSICTSSHSSAPGLCLHKLLDSVA